MLYYPRNTKYRKKFRGNFKYGRLRFEVNTFGSMYIKAVTGGDITGKQIEACRRVFSKITDRNGKMWIKICPNKSLTKKPNESRMGKGKGEHFLWVAKVPPGRILFEFEGVELKEMKEIYPRIRDRLPIKIRLLYWQGGFF